ncbi:MAG TPA: cytochrome c peroxidase [Polyangia bacterium]
MRRTLGLALVFVAAGARGDIPKIDALAHPKPADQVGLPRELTHAVTPADNPTTPDKVALGEKLFFDGRLSADGTVACASCHEPDNGFAERKPTSVGIKKQVGHRNAPTVLNALYNDTQFWDGRAHLLEDQAKLPITNPIEMGQPNLDAAVAAVAKIPEYRDAFPKVFGRPVNGDDLARALAAYERTQIAFDAPFDRFLAGDEKALDASQRRGWAVFNGRGRCMSCHGVNGTQPTFSDNKFHNVGVSAHKANFAELAKKALALVDSGDARAVDRAALETDLSELGRFLVTKNVSDVGAFKTSTLRNVLVTGPYFHDGSQDTLWDVVDHYNKGGVQNPYLDGGIQRLGLSEGEIDDLVAFLASLTSDHYAAVGKKELARQRARSRTRRPERDEAAALGKKAQVGLGGPFGDPTPQQTLRDPSTIGGR